MIPFQFNVDIITELEKTLPSFKLVVPSFVIDELLGLKKNKKVKIRVNAELAIKIAKSHKITIKNIFLNKNESVDNGLLRISRVLATNDKKLKEKARKKGITIVYLRQRRYLAIDGYVNQ
ncbi:MAG: twitching motility protein PilT [Methanobrevibacter sp.]|jgi:rRNA-processing protein FCF1|nr:twitching motility protein PilT [Candidatus Methanovirga aequatorialis]